MTNTGYFGESEPISQQQSSSSTSSEPLWINPTRPSRPRNGWLVLLFSLITIGVYAIAWIYRLQQEHPRRAHIDPAAGLWLSFFISLTLALFAALIVSEYGVWTDWADATFRQRAWFITGLCVGVLFNVWFGIGALRLTTRFHHLLQGHRARTLGQLQKYLLVFGVTAEMIAMTGPPAVEAGLIHLHDHLVQILNFTGSLGTGSLFAWAIVLHRDANELANRTAAE